MSYLGLNPRVKQFGGQPASHGRITKKDAGTPRDARRSRVGGGQDPGPLRAFYERVRGRRGMDRGRATPGSSRWRWTMTSAARTTPLPAHR